MRRNKFLMAPEGDTGSGGGEQPPQGGEQQQQQQTPPAQQPAPFDMNAFLGQLKQTVHETVNLAVDARLGAQRQQPTNGADNEELIVEDDTKKFVARVMQEAMTPLVQTQRAIAD